ncbi:MAG TPA: hypothetical protein VJ547_07450 [Candidatus Thermoplasmatota archaeon]|nr:hypothetical protein [Candidatus Thermoplasmatota archaeon]
MGCPLVEPGPKPAAGGERLEAPEPEGPLYRRSHPYRAFVVMTAPFLVLWLVVGIPFLGLPVLLVLMPVEFGRIGGRRLARGDALWVAVPAALSVATFELALVILVLQSIPGNVVEIDALGLVVSLLFYGLNAFFFSVGALSTAFDPHAAVEPPAFSPTAP